MPKAAKVFRIMGSVKPTKMWIDGTCFEIYKNRPKDKNLTGSAAVANNVLFKQGIIAEHIKIGTNVDGEFCATFRLPTIYYEKITRLPNYNIKDLENSTKTVIAIPNCNSDGSIVVTGKNIEDVADAQSKLQAFFSKIRDEAPALQFISIPVHNEAIKTNFQKFKDEIVNGETKIEGLHESIFQKREKLHLTIVVFTLFDDAEKSEAIKALNNCKSEIMDPLIAKTGPLRIKVSGIDCMNANYAKVNILYANANILGENEEHSLQKIANSIAKHFYERGLVCRFQENVKLHVTLMNTKYRKVDRGTPKWAKKKLTFDATTIMDRYKNYDFGESSFEDVQLSLISSIGEDGFYKPLSIITF